MKTKRRKINLSDVASLERSMSCQDVSFSRPRRRKSSLNSLADIENASVSFGTSIKGDADTMIPCGQSVENNNNSLHDVEYQNNSDDDLFGNLTVDENRSPSPILPSYASPTQKINRTKRSRQSLCSVNWSADETLLMKCSDQLFANEKKDDPKLSKTVQNVTDADIEKKSQKCSDTKSEMKNDSVFGDIDLSYVENQMNTNIKKNSKSEAHNNSPIKSKFDQVVEEPKPVAASTPSRACAGGNLMLKLKERLKANANQQTASSFHLRDAAKDFSKILLDVGGESQFLTQSQLKCKSLGPFYGLPAKVQNLMEQFRGIKKVYDWQHKCLSLPSISEGKNLIYSLPTSGGKTLVAEILIMRELLCKERDAILVLPFVAIVQEKVRNIAQFADELDFLVEEYAGSKGKIPPTKRRKRKSLFICTIEKANTLVNSLIEAQRLDSVGLVVVDELHMLGEGGRRGATIEMTLAKIMHVSCTTQIIGMSATLSNIGDLATFLHSEVYTNDFRPVTLDEHVKYEDSIYKVDTKNLNPDEQLTIDRPIGYANKEMSLRDTDHLATLVLEVIPDHSCLIFCATKKNCENVATMICKLLPESLKERKVREKKGILETLYQDSGNEGICPVLLKTIPYGVAYHHSGLTSDERRLIEGAYTDGVLCVITCTSTLAAGVNLPARRVIIRSPYVGRSFLSRAQYKQMVGRAGRAGIDTKGESYLILTKTQDKQRVMELVTGPVETCISSLMYDGGKGFKTLILNLIGLKIMTKLSDVKDFFSRTLISVQLKSLPDRFSYLSTTEDTSDNATLVENVTKNALQELLNLKLIKLVKLKEDENSPDSKDISDYGLEATKLGIATNRGSIDLTISNIVYDDMKLGLQNLVLLNYLHLLYLVTPHDACANIKPNWMFYFEEYGKLTPDEQTAATVIGVPENFIAMKAAGHRVRNKKFKDDVVSRFYVTLMLYHLFRGKSVWEVSVRFEQPRGFLQSLLSSSAAFASCVLHFTKELEEFWPYHALLEKLIQCLQYCTTAELIPLMEIPGVKIARAKQLFNSGFKSLAQIAKSEANNLVKNIEHLSKRQALQIIASAKVLLKEKIEELQAEAEELQTIPDI
ncbi:helicase POLQ-like [Styela clava]